MKIFQFAIALTAYFVARYAFDCTLWQALGVELVLLLTLMYVEEVVKPKIEETERQEKPSSIAWWNR